MIEDIRNIKSGKKELRDFGITIGIVLALIGGLLFWRGKPAYIYFFIVSPVLILLGVTIPGFLKPLYIPWMTLAVMMGWVVSRVILTVLFYLIITPISFIGRLCGAHFLDIKFRDRKDSYWVPKKESGHSKESYENQF